MRLEDLMRLTNWIATHKQGRGAKTIAIVAASDVVFGVSRMFEALQHDFGWRVRVFRDEKAATAWLRAQP